MVAFLSSTDALSSRTPPPLPPDAELLDAYSTAVTSTVEAAGAAVVVNDVGGTMHGHGADPSVADAVVEEIARKGGVAVASHDSVATPAGGEAIVRAAVDRFGRLDAVVSNAGIFQTVPFDELSHADWRRMLEVHLDGGFHLSQPAFRVMKAQGYGRFVFIASWLRLALGQETAL